MTTTVPTPHGTTAASAGGALGRRYAGAGPYAGADVVLRAMAQYPVVDQQGALWECVQRGLAAQDKLGRARSASTIASLKDTVRAGTAAHEELAGANYRLALKEANGLAEKRYPGRVPDDLLQEVHAEAWTAVAEAIATYDPAKGGSLPGMVVAAVRGRVRGLLAGPAPDSWARVARSAARAESELTGSLGRMPDQEEVRGEVLRYSLGWAKDRLIASGVSEDAPDLDELARKKLVRQGTLATLGRLDQVRATTARPLSLDAPSGDGTATLADMLSGDAAGDGAEVMAWFLASLVPEDRDLISRRFGLEGGPAATFEELGSALGLPWVEVRARIAILLGRMRSPVAQFVSLDGGLPQRFEAAEGSSVVDRLRARSGRRTSV